jgi:hypothetical protein
LNCSKFWQPVTISQDSKDVDIAANIKLIRIDLTEEKEFSLPSANSWIDKLVKPDPRVVLKKMFDGLEQAKISKEFSDALPSDKNQLQAHKEKYVAESTVFEIVNTGSLLTDNQAATINELLPKFKKRLEQDIVAGVTPLKYVVLYNLSPAAVVISPIVSKPAAKEIVSHKK